MAAAFSNTAPGASGADTAKPGQSAPWPRRKRNQVIRACDWCRKHRVKCDTHSPCSNCAKRGGGCSNESMNATSLPLAHREIERLRQKVLELELELQRERAGGLAGSSSLSPPALSVSSDHGIGLIGDSSRINLWGGIRMSTARSPHKTWYGPSSLFYFISRINAFLDGSLQQRHSADHMLLDSSSRRLDEPAATPEAEEPSQDPRVGGVTKATYLSPTQEEYFLDLFWQSYHTSLFPILDETAFKEHYRSLWTASGNTRKPSALVDIVVAMCMQYGMSMLPAVKQQVFGDHSDAAIAGRWHYRRSQTLLARELESPTVSTLQCHLLSCIYLCCGSFQNMADSACGLAVRAAYMLGLHLNPPQTMPRREREMRKRLWWALYVLDSKIGMKLGRPFLLPHLSSATPSLPGDDLDAALQSGSNFAPLGDNVTWLSFDLQQSKLFQAARTVHTAFYDRSPNANHGQTMWDDQQALASHAEFLGPYMRGLDEWAAGVPVALRTERQGNGAPFSTDDSPLNIEQFAPLWLQRQRLLLELMYHHLCANLYRPFISFSSPTPTSATVAEEAALKCALHAMAVTRITHQVLSTTNILAGWHEAFQLQWNAALTLVGFVLAHPHHVSTADARKAMDQSVAVFDIFSDSFAVAASAAKIMRDLGAKVNFLHQHHQQQQQGQGEATSGSLDEANEAAGQTMMMPGNAKILEDILSMPDISTVSKTWDGTLSRDDLNAASMQDVFNMAFAVDEWSNLDSLWPTMDQVLMPEQYILGL
ncbi:fungal-specific transcription factor domain-containing protein [Chaetomium strumarium]|uniref:Fungal-specific transcription factor domain-containing protein n=1 Tax=Chaetomium strumarium TaxID=1170767 RepID=A0AAJ0H1Y9_9PEZI|nr:fungal-specific transcription factor domain-containing protein [Chaetomium strumarium]